MRPFDRSMLPLALLLAAACGGGSEPAGPPASLVAVTPGPFTGTVGEPLSAPVQVRVTDANGRAVPGVAVGFAVTGGAGTVSIGGLGGTTVTDTTGPDGTAGAEWTLGTEAGEQGASATVVGVATVSFAATAEAGPPAGTVILQRSAFIAPVSSPTDEPLAVRVEDEYGNAVPGAVVGWAALSAGAGVSAASTTADTGGIAEVGATLGTAPGLYLFTSTAQGAAPDTMAVIAVTAIADPAGDQAPIVDPAYVSHDVTRFGAAVIQDVLILYAKFAAPFTANQQVDPTRTAMIANYDLDLDGDSLTGYYTVRRCIPGGDSLGFGADAFVDFNPQTAFFDGQSGVPAGAVAVLRVDSLLEPNRCTSSFNGGLYAAVPAYQPTSVTIGIPLAFLLDDGTTRITTLFGHPGTGITDVVPDSLAWDFVPVITMANAPGAEGRDPWDFLPVPRPAGPTFTVERQPVIRRLPGR